MHRCAHALRSGEFSALPRRVSGPAVAGNGRRQALSPHCHDQWQEIPDRGRWLLERGAAAVRNAFDEGFAPGHFLHARTDVALAPGRRWQGADPLLQRATGGADRRRPGALLRAGRRSAAGRRCSDRRTPPLPASARLCRRANRQPRQWRFDRRRAVRTFLCRSRAAGCSDLCSRAAALGDRAPGRPVSRAGGAVSGGHRPCRRIDDYRRNRCGSVSAMAGARWR